MTRLRKRKLDRVGFTVGAVQEFLGLSDEETALIELKVRLVEMLRDVISSSRVTQTELAKRMSSSQSRVAKIEKAGADVSLDLICKALFAHRFFRDLV